METVNLEILKEKKLVGKSIKKVKIFGNTAVTSKITIEGINLTKGAKESIENAGGKIVVSESNEQVESNKKDSEIEVDKE